MSTAPVLPGATVGIVGGGQLGRMLAMEARRLGYRSAVLDPAADPPAAQVADIHLRAPLGELRALEALAAESDVVTLEWENADADALHRINQVVPVRPGPGVLHIAQNRLREKETARRLGIPVPAYAAVSSRADLLAAFAALGTPLVLKTTQGGYDGLGQRVLRDAASAETDAADLLKAGAELIAEAWVPFAAEASAITARSLSGEIATFPVFQNVHREGILHTSVAPAHLPEAVQAEARRIAEVFAVELGLIGLLAVELFVGADGELWFNEMAPRPHNSGHLTWGACGVSQFEQHLRAVCGLPLGRPTLLRPAAMLNLLGLDLTRSPTRERVADLLRIPETTLHWYGKGEARPRRKMGHLLAIGDTAERALSHAEQAHAILTEMPSGGDPQSATPNDAAGIRLEGGMAHRLLSEG